MAVGIIATILFFVFRVELYEMLYYSQGFSNLMYNNGVYSTVAAITALMAWGGSALYYYVINSVRFDRWYHWLATAAIISLIAPIVCYFVTQGALDGTDYAGESMGFEMFNIIFAFLLFVIASFSIRWWSSNCRHTPIPQ